MTPRLLNYADAAAYLGIAEKTLRNRVSRGLIAHVKLDDTRQGSVRFDIRDLDALIETRKIPPRTDVADALEAARR